MDEKTYKGLQIVWSDKEAKSRWESYWTRYKDTHDLFHSQTGFRLIAKDEAANITTLAEKKTVFALITSVSTLYLAKDKTSSLL